MFIEVCKKEQKLKKRNYRDLRIQSLFKYEYPVDLPYSVSFTEKLNWLAWLFVTGDMQFSFDRLKAHHPVITTFAYAVLSATNQTMKD